MSLNGNDGWSCQATLTGTRERGDVRLGCWKHNQAEILIEVELRRGNPVVNAIKTWRWARGRNAKTPLILVHALSHYYSKGGSTRAKTWNAYMKFVGDRIKEDKRANLTYIIVRFKYRPKKHARGIGGAGLRRARLLAHRINKRLAQAGKSIRQ